MVWTQALTFDGRGRLAEPATLRYMVLHAPARIVRSGRRLKLRIQHDWPWAARAAGVVKAARDLVRLHATDPASVFLTAAARMQAVQIEVIAFRFLEDVGADAVGGGGQPIGLAPG